MASGVTDAGGAATRRITARTDGGGGAGGNRVSQATIAFLFLLPAFAFLAYFLYYPALTAFRGAFTDWDGVNAAEWIGFENFQRMLEHDELPTAIRNNVIWAVGDILLALVPAFLVAELIFHVRSRRLQYWYRTLFVIPLIVPGIVTILLWRNFYAGDGVVNQVFGALGLGALQHNWLTDRDVALGALIAIGFPWIRAFNLLIFYAGLQNISREVIESAELDGATGLRRIWSVDLPLVMPQFKLLFMLAVIGAVQNIVTPLVLTDGGPGSATTTPSLIMYQEAVRYGEFGLSMAIATALFVVVLVLTVINSRFIRPSV